MSNYNEFKEAVFNTTKKLWEKDLVSGSSGNVSARIKGEEKIAITPTSVEYERLKKEEIVIIDFNQKIIEGSLSPSSESKMHIGVYKKREDVGAVIHTHSIYATILSILKIPIPPLVEEMVRYVGGEIEVAKYGQSGSEELAKNALSALKDKSAVLLANHGTLVCGKNLDKAFKISELVERIAKIYVLSLILGKPNLLPEEVIEEEKEFYKSWERGI